MYTPIRRRNKRFQISCGRALSQRPLQHSSSYCQSLPCSTCTSTALQSYSQYTAIPSRLFYILHECELSGTVRAGHFTSRMRNQQHQSNGYSALPSPQRIMRRTHTQRDRLTSSDTILPLAKRRQR